MEELESMMAKMRAVKGTLFKNSLSLLCLCNRFITTSAVLDATILELES